MDLRRKLAENLERVRDRMTAACRRAGRKIDDVTLVGVTKQVSCSVAEMLFELGIRDLGESRPQELWRKSAALPNEIRWHLIGHLQRNKIEKTLPMTSLLHSADSLRLLEAINFWAVRQARIVPVLAEINISGEDAKTGMSISDWDRNCDSVATLRGVQLLGLMTMAAFQEPEACRPTFRRLRELRDRIQSQMSVPLPHLSMGMSNDFEIAIEEGSTMVRIGSDLFQDIPKEALNQ